MGITSNIDEVKRNLEEKARKIEELTGKHEVQFSNLDELFTPDFMKEYTNFNSIDEMFHADGSNIESKADVGKIPNDIWNEFICKHTQFADWVEMQKMAWKEHFTEKVNEIMK